MHPRRNARSPRTGLGVAALALLVATLVGCGHRYPTPPPVPPLDGIALERFDRVDADLYRSAQPTLADFRLLAERFGIRTVIKLNRGDDEVPPGMTVIERPLRPLHTPSHADLVAILDAIDRAEKPVLVQCSHGEDRTGLVVALHRMRRGESVDVAYADMMRRGFHPYRGLWNAWLRESGWGHHRRRDEPVASSAE